MNPIQQSTTQNVGGSSQRVDVAPSQGQAQATRAAAQGAATSGSSAGDTVSISQSARQLLQTSAQQPGGSASPQRLSALRQAIASGSYAVDTRQIAQGLLRDSQALLQPQQLPANPGSGGGSGGGA